MLQNINIAWFLVIVMFGGMVTTQRDADEESESGGDGGGDGDSGNSIDDSGGYNSSVRDASTNATAASTESYSNRSSRGDGHGFFRTMSERGHWVDTRRVFGGAAAKLEDFPRICALLDRYMGARCSGALVARRWVLTAAHCISPNLAYVKYNSRHPLRTNDGKIVAIQYLYKHPEYKVLQEDVGRGMDVTLLHHDVGLVRTRGDMSVPLRGDTPPLDALRTVSVDELRGQEVQVLGYGRTETTVQGEELVEARLRVVDCDRPTWTHCVCGVAVRGASSGVCSGDSGGPVLHRGVQVGVTSMGPLECARENASWPPQATSVFTALLPYTDIINRTILDAEESMQKLSSHATLHATLNTPLKLFLAAVYFIHV